MRPFLLLLASLCALPAVELSEVELDTLEAFAFAEDRERALARFVPGSDQHRYFRCLLAQHDGRLDEADAVLAGWPDVGFGGAWRRAIVVRQAALRHATDPAAAFVVLRRELREADSTPDAGAWHPRASRLDQAQIDPVALRARWLAEERLVDHLSPIGLAGMLPDLQPAARRLALDRFDGPDVPTLADAVAADLRAEPPRAFGTSPIHRRLTRAQLARVADAAPEALAEDAFAEVALGHVALGVRGDAAVDDQVLARACDDLLATARGPALVHARVLALGHRVALARRAGAYDRDAFRAWLDAREAARIAPRPTLDEARCAELAGLPRPVEPTDLIDDHLVRFLGEGDAPEAWADVIPPGEAAARATAARVLAGALDAETAYRALDPAHAAALQQRVELAFAPDQRRRLGGDEAVTLRLRLKRVERLLVRIWRLDAAELIRRHQDGAVDLGGLAPDHERDLAFAEPAHRRHQVAIELPECARPGMYAIELVGGGLVARATLRKGDLAVLTEPHPRGRRLTVLDETGSVVAQPVAWIAGARFAAGDDGAIIVPFATYARRDEALVVAGDRAAAIPVDLVDEQPSLAADVLVEQDQLLADALATLVVRARPSVSGSPVPLAELADARFAIDFSDPADAPLGAHDQALTLADDGEAVARVTVPAGATAARWRLSATRRRIASDAEDRLQAEGRISLNGAHREARAEGLLLRRDGPSWRIEVRGAAGEPIARRPVTLELGLTARSDAIYAVLASADDGTVELGALDGVVWLRARLSEDRSMGEAWYLAPAPVGTPGLIHLAAGDDALVPWPDATPVEATLLLGDGERWLAQRDDLVRREPGALRIVAPPPGEYRLRLRAGGELHEVAVLVADGARQGALIATAGAALGLGAGDGLAMTASVDGDDLLVRLPGASPTARIHVLTARAWPVMPRGTPMPRADAGPADATWRPAAGAFADGTAMDEEHRYVLERRGRKRLPGVMLERPSLLLDPREAESDDPMTIGAGDESAGDFGARHGGGMKRAVGAYGGSRGGPRGPWSSLDWLATPGAVLANRRFDADGILRIPLADLGDAHVVRVVAVDGARVATQTVVFPIVQPALRERRQTAVLAAEVAWGVDGGVRALQPGESLEILDAAPARVRIVDGVAAFLDLARSVRPELDLSPFRALARWPQLDAAGRSALQRDLACHELHLLLARRDPAYAREVLGPYLANKAQPTLIDRWVVGDGLEPWLAIGRRARLNPVERALLAERLPGVAAAERRELADDAGALVPDAAALERFARRALAVVDTPREAPVAAVAEPERPVDAVGAGFTPIPDAPRLYIEAAWHDAPSAGGDPALIAANPIWAAYAARDPARPFLPTEGLERLETANEWLLALALSDLPFAPAEHRWEPIDGGRRLVAGSPTLVAFEAVRALPGDPGQVVVRQRVVEATDAQSGKDRTLALAPPYAPRVRYVLETVVANLGDRSREVQALIQLPVGAVALAGGARTRIAHLALQPYGAAAVGVPFYFPETGERAHGAAHVSGDGRSLAASEAGSWAVVDRAPRASWTDAETADEVLAGLGREALDEASLDRIAWRGADPAFFTAALAILRERRRFHDGLWRHALGHGDALAAGELLVLDETFRSAVGRHLVAPLVTVDDLADGRLPVFDIVPMPETRAHPVPGRNTIACEALGQRWHELLGYLAHKPALDDLDRAALVAGLLLQERVAEALPLHAAIVPERLASRLQYDYCRAWLDLARGDLDDAARTAAAHREHPMARWRERFAALATRIDDLRGQVPPVAAELANGQAYLHLEVGDATVTVRGDADRACELRWHAIDLETLFTRAPFAATGAVESLPPLSGGDVQPATLDALGVAIVEVPEAWRQRTALVVATAPGARHAAIRSAHGLDVAVGAAAGRVQVRSRADGHPLGAVYVKAYRELADGSVAFHRDGYTDGRGLFDYGAVRGPQPGQVRRIALYIDGDAAGAIVRIVDPPAQR